MKEYIVVVNCKTMDREDLGNLCETFNGKHITDFRQKLNSIESKASLLINLITVSEFCTFSNDELFDVEDNWIQSVQLEDSEIIFTDTERFEIIDKLVDNDVEDIRQALANEDASFLSDVLMGNGYTGYMKLNDGELQIEITEREDELAER